MDYMEWNNLIASHFFNEENAGREILLYVNNEIINNIGEKKGSGVDDFIESVKLGTSLVSRSGFCQKALQTFEDWRDKCYEFPPYIAYLAFFVLAASIDGDFAHHAYYPRLGKLLGENCCISSLPSFDKMILLWDDLEKWSVEEKHEELGRFVARIRGGQWKVGLPLSQTIISKDEKKRLPIFFEKTGLDPSAPPSSHVMLHHMRRNGEGIFERRTQKLLLINQGNDDILKKSLIEMVLDELEEWDGSVQLEEVGKELKKQETYRVNGNLRICIRDDDLLHVKTSIRLKVNHLYPEEGLIFKSNHFPKTFFLCEESYQGWSKELKREGLEVIDGSDFDWLNGVHFEDGENKWKVSLKGNSVRLFTSGTPEGIPGWIEINKLNRYIKFRLLTYGDATHIVRNWGKDSCDFFKERKVSGLPTGWSLFEGENASSPCNAIDVLTISSSARIQLRGGVKLRPYGNTYLYSSPPTIVLENVSGDEIVTANGSPLIIVDKEMHVWKIPKSVQPNELLSIEVQTREGKIRKRLWLEEAYMSSSLNNTPWNNMKGRFIHDFSDHARIRGAFVQVPDTARESYPFLMGPIHSKRLIFIGNTPGQILECSAEPHHFSFEPVWLIEKTGRKNWKVSYCRNSIHSVPFPEINTYHGKKRDIKRWKEYVWVKRKKIKGHKIPLIKKKWLEFCKAAKNV